eukprot:CAMPEP_0176403970 /NCGR_PEP_ID=MMETSP0126-20121128/50502_1 /TAXON_ID=141414 ORGANISM="Strombidinopsis acuminatum, Strain SPMC142" /NCGR_SAMPLE_ID=MMETSP0126 /ASSEMBLY_ACC=CAM_ASM_000229 /LENGTH=93 /DNA_ID=CAMNT_0017782503 /DNA_START=191 /DNA_END=473 /DNA_ORIENTATION=-
MVLTKELKPVAQQEENSSLEAKETCGSECQSSAQSGSLKEKFLCIDDALQTFDEDDECHQQQLAEEASKARQSMVSSESASHDEYAASVLQGS